MRILSKRRAARNLHADQRGTAAVLTACLSAIFALTIIALIAHAHRFNRILALEHNIEKSSAQNASLLAQFLSARIHGNTAPLDVSTELLWSHTVPTLAAAAGSASEYPAQTRTLFLSMLSSPYSGAPRPDWGLLELRLAPSVTACIRWEDSSLPLQDEATASAATCTIISPLTGSVLVPGNLHPETELVIRNLQDQHVSLVVRGSAVISQGIALKNIRRSTIAIIALGNVQLKGVILTEVADSLLLLHSSYGSINLDDDTSTSLCDSDNPPEHLRLRMETSNTARIGNQEFAGSYLIGCPVVKDPIVWPQFKVIGEL